MNLKGSIVAIVTPFNADSSIDYLSLEKLIELHIDNETNGIVVCGTTGEAATLNINEYREVIRFVCAKVNKRIPVIAGSGANNTLQAIKYSEIASEEGVDALLIVSPYYNKPNTKGMYAHYKAIANSTSTSIILYNVPGRTGVNLSPDLVNRLATDFPNIIGIKEAAGNMDQMMELINKLPEDFLIFSGDDPLAFSQVCLGASGCISVAANIIPGSFRKLMWHALNGELEEGRKILYQYLRIMNLNFIESNPIPVKTALNLMGFIKEEFRLPLAPLENENKEIIRDELKSLGIIT